MQGYMKILPYTEIPKRHTARSTTEAEFLFPCLPDPPFFTLKRQILFRDFGESVHFSHLNVEVNYILKTNMYYLHLK